jgi:type IV pilus assembly protein PilF
MRRSWWWCSLFALSLTACASGATPKRGSADQKRHAAAEVQVALGQRYMEQGQLEVAHEKLLKALEYDSNYADAHTVIAVLFERIGQDAKAGEHYRRATELQPKVGAPNNNYGAFLCKNGKLDEASKYFERAVADPFYKTPDIAYTNAGSCQLRNNRPEQAEANFRRALELNGSNSEALFHLARILFERHDYFKARAFIQRFEALGQQNPDALLLGHRIEVGLGNTREATEYARRLREQFPDSEQARSLESSTPS